MKAPSSFMSAASAVALSAALIVPAASVVQLAYVSAAVAAVVSSIEVRGNRRMDADTIRSYLGIVPGRNFTNADIDEAVKRLFDTGLFSDVRINQVGGRLVVEVSEYAIVNQVLFQGNRRINDADLARQVQLQPRGAFSDIVLEADAETVRRAYGRVGRDEASVTTQVIELGDGRVNVVFQINEGDRTKIGSITFVGNNAFGSRRLQDVISTKRSTFLSFLLRDDIYDEDRLRADEEALRRFYYSRGYADFQIVSSFGELDPARNEYNITFTLDEGARYTFGDITVDSTIPGVDPDSLRSAISTREGRVYNAEEVERTIIALTERVAGLGYAFAEVIPQGDRNFEARTISIVYTIDQGPRTYVERIEIRGNTRTRDYVIRREFDVSEGDAFNQVLIQRAKRRLERLEYFTTVNISTIPGSQPDQVVLLVDVVERSTGEFSIGAGYTTGNQTETGGGVTAEVAVSERNFLGRGQFIRISAAGGRNSRDIGLSFTEPYFLGRRISAGFDIFRQTREFQNYTSELTGGSVRFGLPITEALSTQLAYNLSQEKYEFTPRSGCDPNPVVIPDPTCNVATAIQSGVATSPWVKSSVSGGVTYNTLDDLRNPRSGIFTQFTAEVAGLGGDAEFIRFIGRGAYYHTLSDSLDLVGVLSGGAGHVYSYGDQPLRIFDHFQANDRMVRGFEYAGFGPRDTLTGEHLGGTTYLNASAEMQFPVPVLPPSFGLKGAVFADAATLYGNTLPGVDSASIDSEWRASVGVGLLWASPFGPLRVNYAVPVKKLATDNIQNFSFGVSTRF